MAGDSLTSGQYIQHHLQNMTYGQLPDGTWGFAHTAAEAKAMGFWAFHVDSLAWSVGLAFIFFLHFVKWQRMPPQVYPPVFRILLK